jgi:hypothetical protein
MPTADAVRKKALSLAEAGRPTDEAVRELLELCKEKRVPVVIARQQFLKELEERTADPVATQAADLLYRVLQHLPLA